MRHTAPLLAVAAALAVMSTPAAAQFGKKSDKASDAGTFDAKGNYVLSEAEQKLDCKKLIGRVQLRIMQLRAELADTSRPSQAAQAMQTVTNPALKLMFGGATPYGTDRNSQLKRDHSTLVAYNSQLAAKSCATYDLDAELKKGPNDPPPAPIPKKK